MILVSQWYTETSDARRRELLRCRQANENSAMFDCVDYLDGDAKRWSFGELVEHCSQHYTGKPCVIANTDIIFESVRELSLWCRPRTITALTRWENHGGPRYIGQSHEDRYYSGSQDSWSFIAGSLPAVDVVIPMGVIACDNVIAGWAVSNGVEVMNPCLSIRTMHVHADEARPQRPALYGYYGYPQMTTTAQRKSGVLCHEWPPTGKDGETVWEMR